MDPEKYLHADEHRLATLLRDLVPEPPSELSAEHLLRAADGGGRRRWLPPTLAAAGVAAVAVTAAVVTTSGSASGPDPVSGLPAAATSAAQTGSAPACTPAQLAARMVLTAKTAGAPPPRPDWAVGTVVVLRNTSGSACTLSGYPAALPGGKAEAVHSDGYLHGVRGVTDPGPEPVELAPGATASFAFGQPAGDSGGTFTPGSMLVTPTGGLPFTVPGSSTAVGYPRAAADVELELPLPVAVTAFQAGTSGPAPTGH